MPRIITDTRLSNPYHLFSCDVPDCGRSDLPVYPKNGADGRGTFFECSSCRRITKYFLKLHRRPKSE